MSDLDPMPRVRLHPDQPDGHIVTWGDVLRLELSALGATLRSCRISGRETVLGYRDGQEYVGNPFFLGATVGRYANRIAQGRCRIDGREISLDRNDGANHLHGGRDGFHRRRWEPSVVEGAVETSAPGAGAGKPLLAGASPFAGGHARRAVAGVRYRLHSPDGDAGYPGRLEAEAGILALGPAEIAFLFRAWTDAPTLCNLANHAYWNLDGEGSVLDHILSLRSRTFLEVEDGIPTGAALRAPGLDLSTPRRLGEVAGPGAGADALPGGIDHCALLDPRAERRVYRLDLGAAGVSECGVRLAARLTGRDGRSMEVWTSKPALQVYTAQHLRGLPGRQGDALMPFDGICLESQCPPDAPNQAGAFRHLGRGLGWTDGDMACWDGILRPGKEYLHLTVHRFA